MDLVAVTMTGRARAADLVSVAAAGRPVAAGRAADVLVAADQVVPAAAADAPVSAASLSFLTSGNCG